MSGYLDKDRRRRVPKDAGVAAWRAEFENMSGNGVATVAVVDTSNRGYFHAERERARLVDIYKPLFGRNGALETPAQRNAIDMHSIHQRREQYGEEVDNEWMRNIRRIEAERMARLLFTPPVEKAQILKRQKLLEQLVNNPQLDQLVAQKNGAYLLLEGVQRFNSNYSSHRSDERTLLEMLYDGEKTLKVYDYEYALEEDYSHEEDLRPYAEEGLQAVDQGKGFLKLLGQEGHAWSDEVQELIAELEEGLPLLLGPEIFSGIKRGFPSFISDKHRDMFFDGWDVVNLNPLEYLQQKRLEPILIQIGATIELAKKIRDEKWAKVTFDPHVADGYTNGWNLELKKEEQVVNDNPVDAPVVVYSGANTSGKSFAAKTDFLLRIAGQSLGYAPAEAANLKEAGSFVMVNRPTTDSSQDLSAFMVDVANWKMVTPLIGPHARVYVDEGFSTTSPEDQARLLMGVASFVKAKGGKLMLATHNDTLLDKAVGDPKFAVHHLKVEVGPTGELIRHFKLEPGRSEPHSLIVARMRGIPEYILDWAQKYLSKSTEMPIPFAASEYLSVEQLSEQEREEAKRQVQSLEHLFPDRAHNLAFHLYSKDRDFYVNTLLGGLKNNRPKEMMTVLNDAYAQELVSKMVAWAPIMSGDQMAERQKIFVELTAGDTLRTLQLALKEAAPIASVIESLKKSAKEGFKNLNPFTPRVEDEVRRMRRESRETGFSTDGLQKAIAFLRIQQKMYGENFEHADILSQLATIATLHEQVAQRSDGESVMRLRQLDSQQKLLYQLAFTDANIDQPVRLSDLEDKAQAIFRKIKVVGAGLPAKQFADIPIDSIKEELAILKKDNSAVAAVDEFGIYQGKANTLIGLLRNTDSVYLHQAANFLEQQIAEALAVINGEKEEEVAESRISLTQFEKAFEHANNRGISVFSVLAEGRESKEPIRTVLQQLDALTLFADMIGANGLVPVTFNTTGVIEFQNAFSIFEKNDAVKNTVVLGSSERVQLYTGPNGSGKTFHEKTAVAAVLMGRATGFAPAEKATMPKIDHVVYLDRVTEQQRADLSSFAQDTEYWKRLLELAAAPGILFAAVDEAFSTTSPNYQGALTYAVVAVMLQRPHYMMLSTHNHEVIDKLTGSGMPLAEPYHFKYGIEDTKIHYDYVLQKGHQPSQALAVARTMGLSEEILRAAEEI